MKKTLAFVMLALLALPGLAEARKNAHGVDGTFLESPTNVDKAVFANVGGFLYGVPSIGYEQAMGRKNSWTVSLAYRPWGYVGYRYDQMAVNGSFRWWIAKYLPGVESRALNGIFVGPQLTIQRYAFTYDTYTGPGNSRVSNTADSLGFGGGAEAGYQYIFRPGLLANAGVNVGFVSASSSFVAGAPSMPYAGPYVGTVATIGWAF